MVIGIIGVLGVGLGRVGLLAAVLLLELVDLVEERLTELAHHVPRLRCLLLSLFLQGTLLGTFVDRLPALVGVVGCLVRRQFGLGGCVLGHLVPSSLLRSLLYRLGGVRQLFGQFGLLSLLLGCLGAPLQILPAGVQGLHGILLELVGVDGGLIGLAVGVGAANDGVLVRELVVYLLTLADQLSTGVVVGRLLAVL
uniref:Uncharacterized protein n=1 Tax=Strombidium rassoulzadegani TaxID=1082188 RepID=A0A7S3CIH5_9SPIT